VYLLAVYDALAGKRKPSSHPLQQLRRLAPGLRLKILQGGTQFFDAVTDDASVQRCTDEARAEGAEALNGMRVVIAA
jgi:glycerol-3-phosphate dehydrogenase